VSIDLLIKNGILLTMDGEDRRFDRGAVAVSGHTIAAVGSEAEVAAEGAARTLDARGGIIMPGLVNTHTHAAMTLFRGLADDLPLMEWLQEHIFPAEARLNEEKVYAGSTLACAEMILSGTTCFCDMYLFEGAVARAARDAGVRAVVGEVLYDFPSPHYGTIEQGFAYTEALIEKWRGDPLVTIAVEPHSPYLCAPDLLKRAEAISQAHNIPLVIHISETQGEVDQMMERYGKTPVGHLAGLGLLSPRLLACHCVALTDTDIALLRDHGVKVAHNPESNMKLASGIAPVPRLLEAGVCVALGTDGCSSNNNLDLFGEMDTAAKLHKVHTLDPTVLDANSVLRMATIDGARALGLGDITGSLEPGKRADIIVIDTDKPHLTPLYHPESHLVYAVRGSDVAATIIDGRVVMADRQLTTIDLDALTGQIEAIGRDIRERNGT
jgi:5-methylthioadenosine/S-adenosylhomocysteine deaminase